MVEKHITVAELDELLVVLQDDNYAVGPQDMKLLSICVQLVRATLVVPAATDTFELDTAEEPPPPGDLF